MSDPYARALSALEYLLTPDLNPVARGALDEVQDAVLEAQALHAALMEELRILRAKPAPEWAELDNASRPPSTGIESHKDGIDLLAVLHLLPEEPLTIDLK